MRKLWIGPAPVESGTAERLASSLAIPPVVSRVLAARGVTEIEEARRFLRPSLSELSSPHAFLGADAAFERIRTAIDRGEKILLFGDFDVDGVTGTSLAYRALGRLGANVDYLMPRRLEHGYGLSKKVLPDVLARSPDLLITIDCGIRSVEEVADLNAAGVDVVVTDHHEAGPELPPAVAVVDPKQPGCPYPDKRLAAVGVMYQLLRGVVGDREHDIDIESDLDLVALGTVADVVPLEGENRILVHEGLRVLNRREKIGVLALTLEAEIEDELQAWHLAYLLGPRINAAGRLGDAADAVRLFTTTDTKTANDLAKRLDGENRRRQEISATTLEQALDAIERGTAGDEPEGIVLASNAWHPGVIGIASAKLVERYYRPTVLIAMEGDLGRGSVRSVSGVDVCSVLDDCGDLLVQYGGHEMAAGLTIERERIPELRERFRTGVADRLTEENSVPKLRIDCRIGVDEVGLDLAEQLEQLGPFGFGNPRPVFLIEGARTAGSPRSVGRGHLKLRLRRDGEALDCIGFDLGDRVANGFPSRELDLVGHLAVNEWNGRKTAQVQILDFRETPR